MQNRIRGVNGDVIVTGGCGFLGRHICDRLIRDGWQVTAIDVLNSETSTRTEKEDTRDYLQYVSEAIPGSKFTFYECDILDQAGLDEIFQKEKPTECIHAASLVMDRRSVTAAKEFYNVNVLGTMCVVEAIEKTGTVKHLVFISSRSAVGETSAAEETIDENTLPQPINPYGASKLAAEAFCHAFHMNFGLPVTVCRMQPMYGPCCRTDMMVRRLLEAIDSDQPIQKYGTGEANRDWLYVEDAVEGILSTLRNPNGYSLFNFGTGVSTTLNQLIRAAEEVVGRPAKIEQVDVPPGDAVITGVCNYTRAKTLLGWEPKIPLRTGLTMTYEFMLRERAERSPIASVRTG